ncbi:hypothetical protein DFJ73DRAFT_895497 [Zopfochytrium polystomum]|nr:hypothetical protein DFJ73DRAFT_895497 [Zopfochytrium polystomum]
MAFVFVLPMRLLEPLVPFFQPPPLPRASSGNAVLSQPPPVPLAHVEVPAAQLRWRTKQAYRTCCGPVRQELWQLRNTLMEVGFSSGESRSTNLPAKGAKVRLSAPLLNLSAGDYRDRGFQRLDNFSSPFRECRVINIHHLDLISRHIACRDSELDGKGFPCWAPGASGRQASSTAAFGGAVAAVARRPVLTLIDRSFGSYDGFRGILMEVGMSAARKGRLEVVTIPDDFTKPYGEKTLLHIQYTPIVACDLWEYAYYEDYKEDHFKYLFS